MSMRMVSASARKSLSRMVAYPTSLIFRVARAIENALADLKHGRPTGENDGVDFETFKDITSFGDWAEVEQRAATLRK